MWAEAGLDTGSVKPMNLYIKTGSSHSSTEAKTEKSHSREAMHSKLRGALKCELFSSPPFFFFLHVFDHFLNSWELPVNAESR